MFGPNPRIPDLVAAEHAQLRTELQFLKGCQVQYFTLSVSAAGIVAGFGDRVAAMSRVGVSVYLAPLLVVIPCWWIFFDKATTITRVVAYLRLVEDALGVIDLESRSWMGWENGLARYRRVEAELPSRFRLTAYGRGLRDGIFKSLAFRTTQKYWSINLWTFTALSVASLWLAWLDNSSSTTRPWFVAAAVVAVSFIHNVSIAGRLTSGTYSYTCSRVRWLDALTADPPTGGKSLTAHCIPPAERRYWSWDWQLMW